MNETIIWQINRGIIETQYLTRKKKSLFQLHVEVSLAKILNSKLKKKYRIGSAVMLLMSRCCFSL